MASQWQAANINYLLQKGTVLIQSGDFKKIQLESLLVSIEGRQVTFAEKLIGEKYVIIENPIHYINELRIREL